jgi:hypothetical protein
MCSLWNVIANYAMLYMLWYLKNRALPADVNMSHAKHSRPGHVAVGLSS